MKDDSTEESKKNTSKRLRTTTDDVTLAQLRFPSGPRQKVFDTRILEIVVKLLISETSHEFQIDQELNEVLLIFDNDQIHPINITALLRSADLAHAVFSNEYLDRYLAFLRKRYNGLLGYLNSTLSKMAELPEYYKNLHLGELAAIIMYTDQYSINELVNGKFTPAELTKRARFIPIMVTTLAVLGQAKRQLSVLASQAGVTHTDSGKPLYRRDDLSWVEYHRNIIFFQNRGFTSSTLVYDNSMRGEIQNPPAFAVNLNLISMHSYEHEILFDPDEFVYCLEEDGTFTGRIVNTPRLKTFTYLVAIALRFAFKNALSYSYLNHCGERKKDLNYVYRDNHGLTHTTRKVFYVDPIIEYLSSHSNDQNLVEFCNSITPMQRDFIKLVLIFSVTGRESEAGYKDNPRLYRQYKINSANWFKQFATFIGFSDELIMRGMHIIEQICDPNPCCSSEDKYMLFIASLAHDLDAPRTLNKEDFDSNMQRYHASIPTSTAQTAHWQSLSNYAIECIIITGDRVLAGFTADGKYVTERKDQQLKAGTNPLFCERILEQVPTPDIKRVLARANSNKSAKNDSTLTDSELIEAIEKMLI